MTALSRNTDVVRLILGTLQHATRFNKDRQVLQVFMPKCDQSKLTAKRKQRVLKVVF